MGATEDTAARVSLAARPPVPAGGDSGAADGQFAGQSLAAGLVAFAAVHLTLAVWMAAAPHSFYTAVGPFGAFNSHYVRDTASFEAALAFALLVALRRPAWRVPVLALVTVQAALHSLNHLVDIENAHPRWTGWLDFLSLLLSAALLGWLWRSAARSQPGTPQQRSAT